MIAVAALWLVPSALRAARIAVVVDPAGPDPAAVVRAVGDAAGTDAVVSVKELPAGEAVDPIAKGRLLASLQAADLVVTLADRATAFVLAEREGVPVYFVGASSLLEGSKLASPGVSGVLPYGTDEALGLIGRLGLSPVGVAFTRGYREVERRLAAQAAGHGVTILPREIDERSEVGPAVRDLTGRAKVVWILGDPLLTRGPGFEFLVEQSLLARVPVIAPGRFEVERGALIGTAPDWTRLATVAGAGVRDSLGQGAGAGGDRVREAPPGGVFLVNDRLATKWGFAIPEGIRWRPIP